MSTYLAIIETSIITAPVEAELINAAIINPVTDQYKRYWIGTCSDPMNARASFAHSYPFAPYRVVHVIRSDNRSDILNEALKMKLREKLIVSSWYKLSPDDLIWLKLITTENYAQMIPQIENEVARLKGIEARDVTKRRCAGVIIANEATAMTEEQIEAMRAELLASIQR